MRVISVRPEMVMSVGMRDRMRMDVAPVKMSEGVLVRMGVVPHERIDHDKRRPRDHHAQRHEIHPRQTLFQQGERKQRPNERRNGIVGTRLRRPEHVLRADVEENAQPVAFIDASLAQDVAVQAMSHPLFFRRVIEGQACHQERQIRSEFPHCVFGTQGVAVIVAVRGVGGGAGISEELLHMRRHVDAVCRVGLRQRDEIPAVFVAENRRDGFELRVAGDVHGTGIPCMKAEMTGRLGIR